MRAIVCEKCGASDFYDENGIRTCRYCGARYRIAYTSSIGLDDDVLIDHGLAQATHCTQVRHIAFNADPPIGLGLGVHLSQSQRRQQVTRLIDPLRLRRYCLAESPRRSNGQ